MAEEEDIVLERVRPDGRPWEVPRNKLVTGHHSRSAMVSFAGRLLGFGAFGDVYFGKIRDIVVEGEVTPVAVKSLRVCWSSKYVHDGFRKTRMHLLFATSLQRFF